MIEVHSHKKQGGNGGQGGPERKARPTLIRSSNQTPEQIIASLRQELGISDELDPNVVRVTSELIERIQKFSRAAVADALICEANVSRRNFPPVSIEELKKVRTVHFIARGNHHREKGEETQDAYAVAKCEANGITVGIGLDGVSSYRTSGYGTAYLAGEIAKAIYREVESFSGNLFDSKFRAAAHATSVLEVYRFLEKANIPPIGKDQEWTKVEEKPDCATLHMFIMTPGEVISMGVSDLCALWNGAAQGRNKMFGYEKFVEFDYYWNSAPPLLARIVEQWCDSSFDGKGLGTKKKVYSILCELANESNNIKKFLELVRKNEALKQFFERDSELDTDDFSGATRILRQLEASALSVYGYCSTREFLDSKKAFGLFSDGADYLDLNPDRKTPDLQAEQVKLPLGALIECSAEEVKDIVDTWNSMAAAISSLKIRPGFEIPEDKALREQYKKLLLDKLDEILKQRDLDEETDIERSIYGAFASLVELRGAVSLKSVINRLTDEDLFVDFIGAYDETGSEEGVEASVRKNEDVTLIGEGTMTRVQKALTMHLLTRLKKVSEYTNKLQEKYGIELTPEAQLKILRVHDDVHGLIFQPDGGDIVIEAP